MKAAKPALTLEACIDIYCEAWNHTDAAERDTLLRQVWAEGATYTDPTVHAVGRQALVDHIGRVFERYPNSTIVRTSAIEVHHGLARFAWKKVLADGTSLPEGIDIAEASDDGRLRRIIGFFGPLAPR